MSLLMHAPPVRIAVVVTAALMTLVINAYSQELDVAYVETPAEVIELMLEMVDVGRGDYVIDLGTGDGRIVIAAVKRGAVGLGVDLDPQLVREARENAAKAGLSDRVMFLEQDLFETDIAQATVVTMFLNHEVNLRLRSTLLEELSPGTRVVSHNFAMGEWQPDKYQQYLRNAEDNFYIHDVYFWQVPADARGDWIGKAGDEDVQMMIDQEFQRITVDLLADDRMLVIEEASLHGKRIDVIGHDQANKTQYTFSGSIEKNDINGILLKRSGDSGTVRNWQASRN